MSAVLGRHALIAKRLRFVDYSISADLDVKILPCFFGRKVQVLVPDGPIAIAFFSLHSACGRKIKL